jgi:hypothetical protein
MGKNRELTPQLIRRDVEVQTPFDVDAMSKHTHVTYLDTIGRPAIVLKKTSLTDQHTGIVYVCITVFCSPFFDLTTTGYIYSPAGVAFGKTISRNHCYVWILLARHAIPTGKLENCSDKNGQAAMRTK